MTIGRFVPVSFRIAAAAVLWLAVSSQASADICIDVRLRFKGYRPSPALVEAMQREASSIWEPHGVQFRWRETSSAPCARAQGSFEVLIDDHASRPVSSSPGTLGSTRVTFEPLDHVTIHVDREATERLFASLSAVQVVRALGRPGPGPADVGRALGRIFAHETGHVILGAPAHQSQGLMRPTFLAEDLLRPGRDSYSLSATEVARLRQRELVLDTGASAETDRDSGSGS